MAVYSNMAGRDNWYKLKDLPISQFYAMEVDYSKSRPCTWRNAGQWNHHDRSGGIDNWEEIYSGDGFHSKVDPTNSQIIYACYQNGGLGRSDDGGNSFMGITSGLILADQIGHHPILDPVTPQTVYFGSYKLHKSTNKETLDRNKP
ncbi:MAG: hypothetical protein IPJ75_16275 [Ignavibacteriales bacterium]|nr:hypothetical protein [Ignavibacteriales bacterium]